MLGWALLLAAAAPQLAREPGYPGPQVPDNVFARIARHQAPAAIIAEDADTMAFLDIAPLSEGHTLVIARRSLARSVLDMPPELLAKLMATARRVMLAQQTALGAKGAAILISNGNFQSVPQLHVHVIPTFAEPERRVKFDAKPARVPVTDLEPIARRLAAAMPAR